jgi:hypothetical protein
MILQHLVTIFNKNGIPSVYNPTLLAGSLVRPLYGYIPLESFLSFFISNEVKVMTLMVVLICSLNGVFGLLTLKTLFRRNLEFSTQLFVLLIFIFLPVSAWRIASGHLNFLLGINLFFVLSLYSSRIYKKNVTVYLHALVFLAFFNVFSHPPIAQIFLYLCFFFLPILWKISQRNPYVKKNMIIFFSIFFVLSIINWDQLFLFFKYQLSDEFPRSNTPMIYSYLPFDFKNIMALFVSSRKMLNILQVNPDFMHEVNYCISLGSIVLALTFFKQQTWTRKLLVISILCFIFVYVFGYSFFKNFFQSLPLISMFRVPARFFILISVLLTFYNLYFLAKKNSKLKNSDFLLIIILFPAIFYDSLFLELTLLVISLLIIWYKEKLYNSFFICLCLLNVSLFKERISLFQFNPDQITKINRKIDVKNKSLVFETAFVKSKHPILQFNTSSFFSLSSIEGYHSPLKKFSTTYSYLIEEEFSAARILFQYKEESRFEVLKNIFHINLAFDLSENYLLKRIETSYFVNRSPISIKKFNTENEQLAFMKKNYKQYDFLVDNASIQNRNIDDNLKRCFYQKVKSRTNIELKLLAESNYPCLLVLPFNFSSFLKTDNLYVEILPVDLTLLGLYIYKKPMKDHIIIQSKYNYINYILLKIAIWGCLVILLFFFILRKYFYLLKRDFKS